MKKIVILLMTLLSSSGYSQTTYEVTWEQGTYTALVDYTSMLEENQEDCFWDLDGPTLSFGFDFPFYGEYYPEVYIDSDGVGLFTEDDIDYSLFMFEGSFENFGCDLGLLISDRRYFQGTIDDKQVLVLEWFNAGISDDVESGSPTDHFINFQAWFFENGTIELHFGEIDLDNTPFYEEGTGFMWEDGEVYGPWIGINNPEGTIGAYYTGTYENPIIATDPDDFDILFDIPPEGWIVRWEIDPDATTDEITDNLKIQTYPTIISNKLSWEMKDKTQALPDYISITNSIGKTMYMTTNTLSGGSISTLNLESGIYYISFWNSDYKISSPFVIR